jgi:hypothetical protein
VTTAKRLSVERDGDISGVICARTKQEFFFKWGWTGFCPTGKSPE